LFLAGKTTPIRQRRFGLCSLNRVAALDTPLDQKFQGFHTALPDGARGLAGPANMPRALLSAGQPHR